MTQKVTIQEARTRLDKMNLVDRFLFDQVRRRREPQILTACGMYARLW